MSWEPGLPVLTEADHLAWAEWRRVSKRDAQRKRRAMYPRIDYYPDELAAQVIGQMVGRHPGGNFSSVLNRIVSEWAEALPPEQTNAK